MTFFKSYIFTPFSLHVLHFYTKKRTDEKNHLSLIKTICYYIFSPNSEYSIEALMKSLNRGCALFGLDLNSGWN